MKYHIDTIPVWDAYKTDCECPLCEIKNKCEQDYLEMFMGASVMEPSRRVEVNAKGFCAHHLGMMFNAGNRLGLALMAHTHLKETIAHISECFNSACTHASENAASPLPKRLIGKATGTSAPLNALTADVAKLHSLSESCIFCEKLDESVQRYIYTLLHLWKSEPEFRKAFAASKGLCIPHSAQLLQMAASELSAKELAEFTSALAALQAANLARVEQELEWFTLKFDYRNADKPWGTSQTAVERTLQKLRGYNAAKEKE